MCCHNPQNLHNVKQKVPTTRNKYILSVVVDFGLPGPAALATSMCYRQSGASERLSVLVGWPEVYDGPEDLVRISGRTRDQWGGEKQLSQGAKVAFLGVR